MWVRTALFCVYYLRILLPQNFLSGLRWFIFFVVPLPVSQYLFRMSRKICKTYYEAFYVIGFLCGIRECILFPQDSTSNWFITAYTSESGILFQHQPFLIISRIQSIKRSRQNRERPQMSAATAQVPLSCTGHEYLTQNNRSSL